ncbi:MAG: hypothetical protein AB7G17_06845 [Phycisphaerales bacterium]
MTRNRLGWMAMAGVLALTGCYYEGGPLSSQDRFTYVSRPFQPWTVDLVDVRTGETIWSVDVPVGQQLVVDFQSAKSGTNVDPWRPDTMLWDVMPEGRRFGALSNKMSVPASNARRLEPKLRAVPELPSEPYASAPTPAPETAPIEPAPAAEPTAPPSEPSSGNGDGAQPH